MKKYINILKSTIGIYTSPERQGDSQIHRLVLLAGFLLISFGVVLPTAAMAGVVSGKVYLGPNNPVPKGNNLYVTFQGLKLHSTVRPNGLYRFVLPPGAYTVWYCDKKKELWRGKLYSQQGQATQKLLLRHLDHEHC